MTAVLVATTGGHLTQLVALSQRLDVVGDDQVWVTHRSPQSESLLAERQVEWVPYIEERDVVGVARSLRHANDLLRRFEPTALVSTGSAIAVGYLGYAALRGVPAYYVESAARSGGPSRTGHILSRWPRVRVFTQYPGNARGPWRYAGSVFDGYEPAPIRPRSSTVDAGLKVVVTVGSTDWPFDRLLRRLAEIAPPETDFVWQIGASRGEGLPGRVHDFMPAAELGRLQAEADVVVAHAGCGSALAALDAGRAPILVPRREAEGEIGDDHQDQLADLLQDRGLGLHRGVDDLTWDDVRTAATMAARTADTPPAIEVSVKA